MDFFSLIFSFFVLLEMLLRLHILSRCPTRKWKMAKNREEKIEKSKNDGTFNEKNELLIPDNLYKKGIFQTSRRSFIIIPNKKAEYSLVLYETNMSRNTYLLSYSKESCKNYFRTYWRQWCFQGWMGANEWRALNGGLRGNVWENLSFKHLGCLQIVWGRFLEKILNVETRLTEFFIYLYLKGLDLNSFSDIFSSFAVN